MLALDVACRSWLYGRGLGSDFCLPDPELG